MDPLSLMLGVSGLALNLFGGIQKSKGAAAANAAQQREVQLQLQQEAVRQKYMESDARRKSLEILRNQQRASALALNNATTQGAQFGSGLQGGLSQISGASNTNLQGVSNAVGFGQQMFGINSQISGTKIGQLQGQQMSSEGAGYQALGDTFIKSMGPVKQLTGGIGNLMPSFGLPGGKGWGG